MRLNQQRALYGNEVLRHILALRESLVRHDENLKAWTLLEQCVPYFLVEHPQLKEVTKQQRGMVEHILDPGMYEQYYANNPHEQPFERQYGGQFTVATADAIPRVWWLVQRLKELGKGDLCDFGCNDGWMLAHLSERGLLKEDGSMGVDLAVASIERARKRCPGFEFQLTNIEYAGDNGTEQFDYVTCFEVMEHVFDPTEVTHAAWALLKPGGTFFFSTPYGACEMGAIPEWNKVEHKGHVRAVLPDDASAWVEEAGFKMDTYKMEIDTDGLMLVEVRK